MTNREYLLRHLRAEVLHLRKMETELTEIGLALRFDMVTPETAVQMLTEIGYDFGSFTEEEGS